MIYELPTVVEVNKTTYNIRTDYRNILDICIALNDIELCDEERAFVALNIFYPDFCKIQPDDYVAALKECYAFIEGGESRNVRNAPKLMDWGQDFKYIIAPINKVMGVEVRSLEYMHWWTFLSAFYEIGDCTFAQIVRIRDQKAHGKTLSKEDRQWYTQNRDIVDIKIAYTQQENELLTKWTGA